MPAFLAPLVAGMARTAGTSAVRGAASGAAAETGTTAAPMAARQFGAGAIQKVAVGQAIRHEQPAPAQQQEKGAPAPNYLAQAANAYSAILQGGQFG